MSALSFVALELQTTHLDPASVSQASYVKVVHGNITRVDSWPVIPPTASDAAANASPETAKTWADAVSQLNMMVGQLPVVSYYRDADKEVFQAASQHIEETPPEFRWLDCRELARTSLPDLPEYQLSTVMKALELFDEYGDSNSVEQTTQIVVELARRADATTVEDLWGDLYDQPDKLLGLDAGLEGLNFTAEPVPTREQADEDIEDEAVGSESAADESAPDEAEASDSDAHENSADPEQGVDPESQPIAEADATDYTPEEMADTTDGEVDENTQTVTEVSVAAPTDAAGPETEQPEATETVAAAPQQDLNHTEDSQLDPAAAEMLDEPPDQQAAPIIEETPLASSDGLADEPSGSATTATPPDDESTTTAATPVELPQKTDATTQAPPAVEADIVTSTPVKPAPEIPVDIRTTAPKPEIVDVPKRTASEQRRPKKSNTLRVLSFFGVFGFGLVTIVGLVLTVMATLLFFTDNSLLLETKIAGVILTGAVSLLSLLMTIISFQSFRNN